MAWWWLVSTEESWIENLIVLASAPDFVRAVLVGLAVPAVLKAGAFYVSGNGFGIEFIYNIFRGWATDRYIDCASAVAEDWAQKRAREHVTKVDAHNLLTSTIDRIRNGNNDTPSRLEFFLADIYHALKGVLPLSPAEWGNVSDLEAKVHEALKSDLTVLDEPKRWLVTVAILRAAIRQTNLSFVRKTFVAHLPKAERPAWLPQIFVRDNPQ